MHVEQAPTADRRVHFCIFLISLASLALEVLQMRIFAYSLWHHLAFLVVSIAILGFGASGAFLSVMGFLRRRTLGRSLAVCGLLFMATAFAGPFLLAKYQVDVFGAIGWSEILDVALYYLVFALPYFFAGYAISIAITQCPRQTSTLYFANLVGSGIGCFVLYAILGELGAEASLVAIASIGPVVAVLAPCGFILKTAAILAFAGCMTVMPGINERVRKPIEKHVLVHLPRLDGRDTEKHPHLLRSAEEIFAFKPAGSKFVTTYTDLGQQKILETRWSALGRIDIVEDPLVKGVVSDEAGERVEKGACLFQDGDAPGQMPHRNWVMPSGQIHALSYEIKKEPKALIIGIGGGLDLKVAQERGAREVDAVEINAETLYIYKSERFAKLTGVLEARPDFRLHHGEGRHFVRSSDQKFDLIQMSGVDTYTALANGAYVLSESYLYTKEAFHEYLDHLNEDGLITIIRFAFPAPRETLRVLVIAAEVLRERGVEDPTKHLALLINSKKDKGATNLGAIMVKKSPFSASDLDALDAYAAANNYARKLIPGRAAELPFDRFEAAVKENKVGDFVASYPYAVHAVGDDQPFFFNQFRWSAVLDWLRSGEKQELPPNNPWAALTEEFQTKPVGLMLLLLTFGQLLVLVGIAIFVPLFFLRKSLEGSSSIAPLGYFLCLGLAYILLMISAMQRFGLILGHPSYSVTVVMATFLIGSGLGSLVSGIFKVRSATKLLFVVALLLATAAVGFDRYLPALAEWLLPQSFSMRCLVSVGTLLPVAFLMGMCFPMGIRVLAEGRDRLIPWAYGVNGGASVLGSVLTVALAMSIGFAKVQWVSAGLYILAALLMVRMLRDARRNAERPLA